LAIDVDAGDFGALASAQHRNGAPVSDRRIGVIGGPGAGADDDDTTAYQTSAPGGGALGFGSERHAQHGTLMLYDCTTSGFRTYIGRHGAGAEIDANSR
jgi:hypothetical protein